MKMSHVSYRKKLLPLLILLLLVLSILTVLSLNIVEVSAGDYPAIYIEPAITVDPTLTPGTNFTISIKTNYTGDDVWGYEFTLTYNPLVIQGALIPQTDTRTGDNVTTIFYTTQMLVVPDSEEVYVNQTLMTRDEDYTIDYTVGQIKFTTAPKEVEITITYLYYGLTNGDLITGPKAMFISAGFNNTLGKLGSTISGFFFVSPPPPLTSGPGTLANVTFTVVGIGASNITLGPETKLIGRAPPDYDPYTITDHIQHGYFINVQPIHDVAVVRLVAPATAILRQLQPVSINVTVGNEGNYTESVSVTVYNDTSEIGTEFFTLDSGLFKMVSFSWNISGVSNGTYTINATATIALDEDTSDNTQTKPIEIQPIHDVAVVLLESSEKAAVEGLVPINVTIANKGSYTESVNVTVSYDNTPINTTVISMLSLRESKIVEFNWSTSGVDVGTYTINATATIALDEYPSDNTQTKPIELKLSHDVRVNNILAPTTAFIGELVTINVSVENFGVNNETFEVKVTYDSHIIGNQSVSLPSEESETLPFPWNTTGVAPGDCTLKAEAILDGDENPTNNNKTKSIFVNLPPPGAIAGTVTNSTGNPIVGADVTVNGYSNITDADGHYNITNVPAGTYNVTVSAAGYQTFSQTNITVVARETTTLNFTLSALPTTGTIAGIVTDSSTGDPISGATVTANGMSATTNSSGAYTISDVPAGTYTVTVSANGYHTSSQTDITVDAGATTTVNFELTPAPSTNILLYAGVAAVAIIIIAGIAVYMLKVRKPT